MISPITPVSPLYPLTSRPRKKKSGRRSSNGRDKKWKGGEKKESTTKSPERKV